MMIGRMVMVASPRRPLAASTQKAEGVEQIFERITASKEFSKDVLWISEDKVGKAKHSVKFVMALKVVVVAMPIEKV